MKKMRFVDKYGEIVYRLIQGNGLFCGEKFSFAPQICGENCVFAPQLSLEKVYRADSFLFLVLYICLVSLNKNFNNCLMIINKFVFLH